ncbi:uncharacterized protein LOC134570636 isoform X2 [Pelobates fuscus]|uniref:uncharacterized protein LOC134570636 isoform X2 n=1 Tax=Pelobates fuscus TaxID=191477 RepID=UPI002FE433FE
MNHRENYVDGSYSCCWETSRDSVCEKSEMSEKIRDFKQRSKSRNKRPVDKVTERTLLILADALDKRHSLLVDKPEELRQRKRFQNVPLISPSLVQNLIDKLQTEEVESIEISYWKSYNESLNIINLTPSFYRQREYLGLGSLPGTLIYEASHALGYAYLVASTECDAGNSLSAYDICCAFEIWMNHQGDYKDGAYTCCGERSRDSVCEASEMSVHLT